MTMFISKALKRCRYASIEDTQHYFFHAHIDFSSCCLRALKHATFCFLVTVGYFPWLWMQAVIIEYQSAWPARKHADSHSSLITTAFFCARPHSSYCPAKIKPSEHGWSINLVLTLKDLEHFWGTWHACTFLWFLRPILAVSIKCHIIIIINRRTWSFSLANLKSQFSFCFL